MLIYILYFIFIAILAIQYEFIPFKNNYVLWIIIILLGLMAGFRGMDVTRDYYNYQYIFDTIYDANKNNTGIMPVYEPGFMVIVIFFRNLFLNNYGLYIMLFYAFSSLIIKVYSISKLSINPYLSLLFYYSYFFMLQEMTQIRIALASAILLLSLFSFLRGHKLTFIAFVLLASLFHYSAIFFLIILFFNIKSFNKTLYIILLGAIFLLGILKLPLFQLLGNFDLSMVSDKLDTYVEISENSFVTINVFNSLNIINILCCCYFIFFIKENIIVSDSRLVLFLKLNMLAILMLSALAGIPAFSLRMSQLFSIAQIFTFTYLVMYLPFKKFNIFFLILLAGFIFYISSFYGNFLQPYNLIKIK